MQDQHVLLSGTVLDRYKIIRVLGAGGFGITYLAEDIQLGMEVVIKEYFPNEFAIRNNDSTIIAKTSSIEAFSKGLQRFKEEAQILARFSHPSIVKILGYFEENQTGYFVMEYEEGIDLAQYLKDKGTPLGQEEILSIIMPILEGLKEVHSLKYLHRDIKPANILLRNKKGPVLIDFGASKLALGEVSKSITSMLTEGYAPLEQYSTNVKQQGPFTDLYAVGAVIYKMITQEVPPSAQTRSYDLLQDGEDPLKLLITLKISGYDESFLKAIDRTLSLKAKDRPQTVQDFQADIVGELIYEKKEVLPSSENTSSKNIWMVTVLLLIVIVGGFYYVSSKDEQVIEPTKEKIKSNVESGVDKIKQNKVDQITLEKQKKLEVERAIEIKALKAEKARAQKEEIAQLRREKDERILRDKKTKENRQQQIVESKHLEKIRVSNFYTNIDTYNNGRFGFSLQYPTNLLTKKKYPENGDGVWLSNDDGTVEVTPSAAFELSTSNAKQMYKEAIGWKQKNSTMEITYKRQKNNWYVLSGYDHSENKIFYEKYYLKNGVRSGFTIVFPKNEKKKYEKLVDIIAKNFRPSLGEQ